MPIESVGMGFYDFIRIYDQNVGTITYSEFIVYPDLQFILLTNHIKYLSWKNSYIPLWLIIQKSDLKWIGIIYLHALIRKIFQ